MSSAFERLRVAVCCGVLAALSASAHGAAWEPGDDGEPVAATVASPDVLRVCSDPNNLPYSNAAGEGFENGLATIIAAGLHRRVVYTWWPQRRGFIRKTLRANLCDVVMGVPDHYELVATTRAYYRSSYAFVTRRDRHLDVTSFDDARLKGLTIGVQVVGDDYANPPTVQALAARGLADRVKGYPVFGNYGKPAPLGALVDAVARGEVDIAVVWGPVAGYFARNADVPLIVAPVSGESVLPMSFAIAVGVRHDDIALRDAIEQVLEERRNEIDLLLARYGVPDLNRIQRGGGRS